MSRPHTITDEEAAKILERSKVMEAALRDCIEHAKQENVADGRTAVARLADRVMDTARAVLAGASAVETTDVSGAVEVGKESLRALIAERDTLRAQLNAAEAAAGALRAAAEHAFRTLAAEVTP